MCLQLQAETHHVRMQISLLRTEDLDKGVEDPHNSVLRQEFLYPRKARQSITQLKS